MKVAKKLILLLRDVEGFGDAISNALQPNPSSKLQRLEESFVLSLEKYGIKNHRASGNIIHFLNGNGACEVSILLLENYEPPILACALNEVLASLMEENSEDTPTLLVPFLVASSKLKLENKHAITNRKVSLYGLQFGPVTDSMQALSSRVQNPPPSLQLYHEQLACLLQLVRVLNMPAFVIVGQSGQHVSPKALEEDLEVINEVGEVLASFSSLSFSKERISWNPIKSSKAAEEPWRALYG